MLGFSAFAVTTKSINYFNGNYGIGTTTPSAKLEVNGYTKLGSDAPAIKIKKFTGTTSSSAGGSTNIEHGLDVGKIIGVQMFVLDYADRVIPPSSVLSGKEYGYDLTSTLIYTRLVAGNSSDITNEPIRILITYEE